MGLGSEGRRGRMNFERLLKITDELPPKALQNQGPVQSLKDVLRL